MKKTNLFLTIIFAFLNYSCAWFEESEHQKIIGDYEVGWNDLESNRSIHKLIKNCDGCSEVIIENYVYAVGHNEKYIIAKQIQNFNGETRYFIIDIKKNKISSQKGIFGPLSETEFEKTRKELQIESLKFDLNFSQKPKS
ncbi:DUF3997 domain-containing protein [Flavobacterium buctense]|uniref:DUF3997 domain-containing protein n=1 Tax=Flavobacterium buctense TaxID=1648146 RepID=A0ABU9DZU4_9FLAO|nr:DUF3997 domain-containing protein [Flavobacterium buctense]